MKKRFWRPETKERVRLLMPHGGQKWIALTSGFSAAYVCAWLIGKNDNAKLEKLTRDKLLTARNEIDDLLRQIDQEYP